jgi:hypothetical protein
LTLSKGRLTTSLVYTKQIFQQFDFTQGKDFNDFFLQQAWIKQVGFTASKDFNKLTLNKARISTICFLSQGRISTCRRHTKQGFYQIVFTSSKDFNKLTLQ